MTCSQRSGSEGGGLETPWTPIDICKGIGIAIGSLAVLVVVGLAIAELGGNFANSEAIPWPAVVGFAEAVLLLPIWLMAIRKYRVSWGAVGLVSTPWGRGMLLAGAALLASMAFTVIYGAIVAALGLEELSPEQPVPIIQGLGWGTWVTVVAIAVCVPIVEELFFRGFLFSGLAARFGPTTGALVSSLGFAASHFSVGTLIPIFVTGMVFASVYRQTKSIWVPASAHGVQNLLALTISSVG